MNRIAPYFEVDNTECEPYARGKIPNWFRRLAVSEGSLDWPQDQWRASSTRLMGALFDGLGISRIVGWGAALSADGAECMVFEPSTRMTIAKAKRIVHSVRTALGCQGSVVLLETYRSQRREMFLQFTE